MFHLLCISKAFIPLGYTVPLNRKKVLSFFNLLIEYKFNNLLMNTCEYNLNCVLLKVNDFTASMSTARLP